MISITDLVGNNALYLKTVSSVSSIILHTGTDTDTDTDTGVSIMSMRKLWERFLPDKADKVITHTVTSHLPLVCHNS